MSKVMAKPTHRIASPRQVTVMQVIASLKKDKTQSAVALGLGNSVGATRNHLLRLRKYGWADQHVDKQGKVKPGSWHLTHKGRRALHASTKQVRTGDGLTN